MERTMVVIEQFNKDELNKDTDTIMVRFSIDSNSENYVSPEILGKFCNIIKENGYNVTALPIEADVEIKGE